MTRNADDMGMQPANAIAALRSAASTQIDHERLEYVIQIMKAARDDGLELLVDNLLKEYGEKAFRAGQRDIGKRFTAYVEKLYEASPA